MSKRHSFWQLIFWIDNRHSLSSLWILLLSQIWTAILMHHTKCRLGLEESYMREIKEIHITRPNMRILKNLNLATIRATLLPFSWTAFSLPTSSHWFRFSQASSSTSSTTLTRATYYSFTLTNMKVVAKFETQSKTLWFSTFTFTWSWSQVSFHSNSAPVIMASLDWFSSLAGLHLPFISKVALSHFLTSGKPGKSFWLWTTKRKIQKWWKKILKIKRKKK